MRPSYQCLFFTRDYAVMLSHELVKKKQELSSTSKKLRNSLSEKRRQINAIEKLLKD